MAGTLKKELSLQQIYLNHDNPVIFISSQWQKESKPSIFYLLYRWIIAIIFFVTFVLSIVDFPYRPCSSPPCRAKWVIYLTNWAYTTCTLQSLISAIILTMFIVASYMELRPHLQVSTLKLYKFYWVTNTIATDVAFTITTIYWSFLYHGQTLGAINFFLHAINSILMMIDLFAVAHPVRLLHCCYPVLFLLCYPIFTGIFYAAGGTDIKGRNYIYRILNWNNPGSTIGVCIGVLVLVVLMHIICWGLQHLRIWVHSKFFVKEENSDNGPTTNGYEAVIRL